MGWTECKKCGCATQLDIDFCPYCGKLYKDFDTEDIPTRREIWKQALLKAAKRGYTGAGLYGLACNTGNRGLVLGLVKDFCENADPWDGK